MDGEASAILEALQALLSLGSNVRVLLCLGGSSNGCQCSEYRNYAAAALAIAVTLHE